VPGEYWLESDVGPYHIPGQRIEVPEGSARDDVLLLRVSAERQVE